MKQQNMFPGAKTCLKSFFAQPAPEAGGVPRGFTNLWLPRPTSGNGSPTTHLAPESFGATVTRGPGVEVD